MRSATWERPGACPAPRASIASHGPGLRYCCPSPLSLPSPFDGCRVTVPVPGVNETPRTTRPDCAFSTVRKPSHAGADVAPSWSVISTSLFGSAPWSPPPLTVEVTAQMVTVPLRLTWPVMFRRPSVAGAHGSPLPPGPELRPVG